MTHDDGARFDELIHAPTRLSIVALLAATDWADSLDYGSVDAALSTTALHWLSGPELVAVYRKLGALIRPGGVFLNGDNMDFGPDLPTVQRFAQEARDRAWTAESFAARGIEN